MMHEIKHYGLRWLGMVLALCLLLCAGALAESGSVAVRIHTADGVNVEGARVRLYRVADANVVDANYRYDLTGEFAACGVSLADVSDGAIAGKLAEFVDGSGVESDVVSVTDSQGKVSFSGLAEGLYLVMQDGFAAEETVYFSEINPFIVTVPMMNSAGTDWTYQIDAQPKVNELTTPAPTVKPTEPPEDETLPQTGMLRWPVVALAVGGLMLFSIGWVLMFGGKRNDRNA